MLALISTPFLVAGFWLGMVSCLVAEGFAAGYDAMDGFLEWMGSK